MQATEDFVEGRFGDALVAAQSVCRSMPAEAAPAILRAKVLAACRPTLAPRAWDAAWARDPLLPAVQDSMLEQWLKAGALRRVAEQGVTFLPLRTKSGTEGPLLDLLSRAGVERTGACWRDADSIEVRCFDLAGKAPSMRMIVANGHVQHVYEVATATGLRIERPTNGDAAVFSLAIEGGPLLQGSPICVDPPRPLDKPGRIEPGVDIIIPVYRHVQRVQACLRSVLGSLPRNRTAVRVIVVNDASPEPGIVLWLESLAAAGKIELLHNAFNLGFIASVNRALRGGRREALMLNSDTLVHGDWIDRLVGALHSAPDVASVMPWSNNAEIGSLAPAQKDVPCGASDLALIDSTAAKLRTEQQTCDMDVPTTIGFAMLMRRAVIDRIGALDSAALTRGYLEEVDWCLRARAAGCRHLLATGVFVAHEGSASFGPEKQLRVRQNRAVIAARYPRYHQEYADFVRSDPLRDARRKLLDAIAAAGCLWPRAQESAEPRIDASSGLRSAYRRVAVWGLRAGTAEASNVLAHARRLAGAAADEATRLLVFGHASDALLHTGTVDWIPPGGSSDDVLPDAVLASLAGCTELVLGDSTQAPPQGIRCSPVDALASVA